MDQLTDLSELLKHELKDLYSAETQIIDSLPKMIETARNPQLKKALSDHLKVTRDQKKRLEKIQKILNIVNDKKESNSGFFANLFKSSEGEQHCKAMEGIIKEGESLMKEDMAPEVMDAAIIAAAQKIEHYEIGSYGTARAYAEQMGMNEVEKLLKQTLNEEYFADDSLTKIALDKVNIIAEGGNTDPGEKNKGKSSNKRIPGSATASKSQGSSHNNGTPVNKSAGNSGKSSGGSNASSKKAVAKKSLIKSASKKAAPKRSAPAKPAPKKTTVKVAARSVAKKSTQGVSKRSGAKKSALKKSTPVKQLTRKAGSKVVSKNATKKSAPKKSAVKSPGSGTKRTVAKKSSPAKKSALKKSIRRR